MDLGKRAGHTHMPPQSNTLLSYHTDPTPQANHHTQVLPHRHMHTTSDIITHLSYIYMHLLHTHLKQYHTAHTSQPHVSKYHKQYTHLRTPHSPK